MGNEKKVIIEVCVDNLDQAKKAEKLGADRIELCSRLDLDGLTPERELILNAMNTLNIPIKVMLRPRHGNFVYNEDEIINMEKEIDFCKKIGVNAIVFGVLNLKNEVDIDLTRRLARRSMNMEVTFHKAIDNTNNIIKGLSHLCKVKNIDSVLTSGGGRSIMDNGELVKTILKKFSQKLNIILAGSITKNNFELVHKEFSAYEYHGKAILGKLY